MKNFDVSFFQWASHFKMDRVARILCITSKERPYREFSLLTFMPYILTLSSDTDSFRSLTFGKENATSILPFFFDGVRPMNDISLFRDVGKQLPNRAFIGIFRTVAPMSLRIIGHRVYFFQRDRDALTPTS